MRQEATINLPDLAGLCSVRNLVRKLQATSEYDFHQSRENLFQ